jgi:uncharacterized protein (DUF697 family)
MQVRHGTEAARQVVAVPDRRRRPTQSPLRLDHRSGIVSIAMVSLKLTNLWRVIREVDLEAIRASARTPFELLVIDEGDGQAGRLRSLLGPDPHVGHPWIRVAEAVDVARSAAPNVTDGPLAALPALAIIVSPLAGLSSAQQAAAHALRRARVPLIVVILGNDTLGKALSHASERWIAVPALDPHAVEAIGEAIIEVAPVDLRLSLARQLPPVRPAVFEATIEETAKANASYALTSGLAEVVPLLTIPLNLGDMVVMTKNQLIMSYRIVLAAGRDGEPRKLLGEILGVLGGGMLFRQLARQLIGFIPVAGLIPKVAIAYGGTWAIGRAITLWATEGRTVTTDLVRSMSAEGVERGRAVAQKLVDQARAGGKGAGARWDRLKANLPLLGRRRA